MNARLSPRPTTVATAGLQLRQLRRQANLSQLDLALLTGVSQRHLSCIETGRAKPSPATLHALLMALEAPLEQCNSVFLGATLCGVAARLPFAGGHSWRHRPCPAGQQPGSGDRAG